MYRVLALINRRVCVARTLNNIAREEFRSDPRSRNSFRGKISRDGDEVYINEAESERLSLRLVKEMRVAGKIASGDSRRSR